MSNQTIMVNGQSQTVEAPDEMPLLWVLRDLLHLTGTKFGCGVGQCGACTVHVDGTPTRSCSVNIASVVGHQVVTIEGLSSDGSHPVPKAWCDVDVAQCGYCQAGQIMTAAALLKAIPKPTDDDIDSAMAGNICRCGTYIRIRHAIKVAAGLATSEEGKLFSQTPLPSPRPEVVG
jgi:isoquinoline 1-oxidoreductase alpha subunit